MFLEAVKCHTGLKLNTSQTLRTAQDLYGWALPRTEEKSGHDTHLDDTSKEPDTLLKTLLKSPPVSQQPKILQALDICMKVPTKSGSKDILNGNQADVSKGRMRGVSDAVSPPVPLTRTVVEGIQKNNSSAIQNVETYSIDTSIDILKHLDFEVSVVEHSRSSSCRTGDVNVSFENMTDTVLQITQELDEFLEDCNVILASARPKGRTRTNFAPGSNPPLRELSAAVDSLYVCAKFLPQ